MKFCFVFWCVTVLEVICAECPGYCHVRSGVVALVPARGGSKGIPLKNLAEIDGQSLLCRTLSKITASQAFSEIWVSTDFDIIADEARQCGAKVHSRSDESATDTAPTIDVALDFISAHPDVQAVAIVQCTSPFLCPDDLQQAVETYQKKSPDCVFSATRGYKLRWTVDDDYALPENFDPKNRPRRQDWNGELYENGMFYITTRNLITQGVLQNYRCLIVEIPNSRSWEIDTPQDLQIARVISSLVEKC